jgi:hypothetical protein
LTEHSKDDVKLFEVFTVVHVIGGSMTTEISTMVEEGRNPGAALEVIVVSDQASVVRMKDICKQIHDVHEAIR